MTDGSPTERRAPRVLAAADKFRGSASAPRVCGAIAAGVEQVGGECVRLPLADGGEGTLAVLGDPNRVTTVTGPLQELVTAQWRLDGDTAYIECASVIGLELAGGREGNDALAATSRGVGELIAAALSEGARTVIVAVGGTATTDGGLWALTTLEHLLPLPADVDLIVACDVTTTFVDAAAVFAPQKGADEGAVAVLTQRLEQLALGYRKRFGVDVSDLPGAGAAGGLAGGLAAIGAQLVPGFAVVARHVGLAAAMDAVDIVVTGEGRLDRTSFAGKVVGAVAELALERELPVIVVTGQGADVEVPPHVQVLDLSARFGGRSWSDLDWCIQTAVSEALAVDGAVSNDGVMS